MEGEVRGVMLRGLFGLALCAAVATAQEKAPAGRSDAPEISLRKSINTRVYQGREIEGEDRCAQREPFLAPWPQRRKEPTQTTRAT